MLIAEAHTHYLFTLAIDKKGIQQKQVTPIGFDCKEKIVC